MGSTEVRLWDSNTGCQATGSNFGKTEGMPIRKVFVSHAATDKKLADYLVDLLQTGVDVQRGQIVCTSLEGMGIPKGTTFVDWIRDELVGAQLVIALITPEYFESAFCLCELGATWATKANLYPLIVPPLTYAHLKAVLVGCQAGVADTDTDLDEMFERVKIAVGTSPSIGRWNQKKIAFIARVRNYSKSVKPPRPTAEEAVSIRETVEALQDEIVEATELIEEQKELIEQLRSGGTDKGVRILSKTVKAQLAELERLNAAAGNALWRLPPVVREALYLDHIGNELVVDGWKDQQQMDDAYDALQRGYLKGDPDAGTFSPDDDNQSVEDAIGGIAELSDYLRRLSDPSRKAYRSNQGYSPDLTKRPYWEDNLRL